ncbi:hypothetical protein Xcel_2060 [Xylanimonas cellulosilytica DSM 15894]|uniref:Tyr recombinase domain-containing protein n=1 Tax=Xylanimonas cellulosilytica (strain DSM 15894 / JCM 12276 / CECT 5975 / KCTC 9989 / LMG 20990 / NBRC 107835 / XIL07) TaxID=446471 RepID=D1BU65_XYLCX|nr:tyrosine-type recombinase/integrase [Xylanimonas cellulosilytica]ACZ31078.1 hypothetical protein Xcel_2060 [Xylanimonas cellulosilytica DSM 15894]
MGTRWSENVWNPAKKRAGLTAESFTMHDLRHFYASALIHHGASVKTVQTRLGHSSATETLETYAHLWPDDDLVSRTAVQDVLTTRADVLAKADKARAEAAEAAATSTEPSDGAAA